MANWTNILQGIAAVLWPLVVAVIAIILLPELRQVFSRVGKATNFTLKWGDKELSVQEGFDNLEKIVRSIVASEIRRDSIQSPTVAQKKDVPESHLTNWILWVDDKPENNIFESKQLKSQGWLIDEVRSTEDAISLFDSGKYGLVITDMYRKERKRANPDAGIDLLKALRPTNPTVKVICYCGEDISRTMREKFLKEGGYAITSSPIKLLKYVGFPKPPIPSNTSEET